MRIIETKIAKAKMSRTLHVQRVRYSSQFIGGIVDLTFLDLYESKEIVTSIRRVL